MVRIRAWKIMLLRKVRKSFAIINYMKICRTRVRPFESDCSKIQTSHWLALSFLWKSTMEIVALSFGPLLHNNKQVHQNTVMKSSGHNWYHVNNTKGISLYLLVLWHHPKLFRLFFHSPKPGRRGKRLQWRRVRRRVGRASETRRTKWWTLWTLCTQGRWNWRKRRTKRRSPRG